MKFAMLIALTTASRSADLTLLDTKFMVDKGDKVVFSVRELGKTRKVGQSPPKVEICGFQEEPNLGPLRCLNEYLMRTKNLRPLEGCSLFLRSTTPHKAVNANTVAGWLKTILARAGVDTTIWGAHSTRGASTSKVANLGVSVQTILNTACWKGVGTFRRFYNKPIVGKTKNQEFTESVLG